MTKNEDGTEDNRRYVIRPDQITQEQIDALAEVMPGQNRAEVFNWATRLRLDPEAGLASAVFALGTELIQLAAKLQEPFTAPTARRGLRARNLPDHLQQIVAVGKRAAKLAKLLERHRAGKF